MIPKNKEAEFKLSIQFLILVIVLAIAGHYIQGQVIPKEVQEFPILNKNYMLVGFASVLLIVTTFIMYIKAPKQLPMMYLALTIFKLGLFITLFLKEEDLLMTVRIAFLLPIMTFLVLEKIYAFQLFKKMEHLPNNSN